MKTIMGSLSGNILTRFTWAGMEKKSAQYPELYRILRQTIMINANGTIYLLLIYGTLKRDSGLFFLLLMISIPLQTTTKAKRVPILVRSVTSVRFINRAGMATTSPVTMVAKEGVLYFGWILEKAFGSRPHC